MNTTSGLTRENVSVGGGQAVLPWINKTLAWTRSDQIAANGTIAATMTANASGLALRANWSNYVRDGGFGSASPWSYSNSTSQNVTAEWNGTLSAAELDHSSPATQTMWDSMDAIVLNWTAPPGTTLNQNTSNPTPQQGTGTMGLGALVTPEPFLTAVRNTGTLNWSAYDRLVLWVYVNVSLPASFNVTAQGGSPSSAHSTVAQPLGRGWQYLVVDLNQLGNATVRGSLTMLTLRFSSPTQFPVRTWFDVDDVRLGTAKAFNESASVSQLISKANTTTALLGSAHLSFVWRIVQDSNAEMVSPSVGLAVGSGPGFVASLGPATAGAWESFSQDVSSATAAAGRYNLSFRLRVATNTTNASDVELLIDNVTLVFPEVTNGTFNSTVLTMGEASDYVSLALTGILPPAASLLAGVRTGNNTVPGSASWSSWDTVAPAGPISLDVPGATYFQIQVTLSTTNASVSPLLQTLVLATRHRGSMGSLTSDLFPADSDFLRWRSFDASVSLGARTTVLFWVGNGTSWTPVQSGANLTSYGGGPSIEWRATLLSSDGLQTPAIFNVTLVYEFLGPIAHVRISPGGTTHAIVGHWVYLQAAAYDAGWHRLSVPSSAFVWSGGDPTGKLYGNGSYLPAEAGDWNVTVSALGFSDTVLVVVANDTTQGGPNPGPFGLPVLPYVLAIVAAAGIGFLVYELVVRRMYAIDDVFMIAKDGRLMVHNTRRMRADRDEDILSGMLTAIMTFLRDQDPEENGELKRFQVGGKTTLLERGQHVYLAAVYSGRVPGWAGKDLRRFMADLEEHFGEAFARWSGSPEDLHGLKEFTRRFVTHVRYHGASRWGSRAG